MLGSEVTLALTNLLYRTSSPPTMLFSSSFVHESLTPGSEYLSLGRRVETLKGQEGRFPEFAALLIYMQAIVNGRCYRSPLLKRVSLTKGQLCLSWEPSWRSFQPQSGPPLVLMMKGGRESGRPAHCKEEAINSLPGG